MPVQNRPTPDNNMTPLHQVQGREAGGGEGEERSPSFRRFWGSLVIILAVAFLAIGFDQTAADGLMANPSSHVNVVEQFGGQVGQGMTSRRAEATDPWHKRRACVAKGKYYDGTWEHMPNKSRPELLYNFDGHIDPASGAERAFRTTHPPDPRIHLPFNQWEWVPRDPACTMVDWDVPLFCKVLGVMNVSSLMIVGDSVSYLQAQSLYRLAQGTGGDPVQFADHWEGPMCEGKVTMFYVRNDILHTGHTSNFQDSYPGATPIEMGGVDRTLPWAPLALERKVDVLILNSGAHVHHMSFYKRAMNDTINWLRENYHGRVVFRTTILAHAGCCCPPLEKPFADVNEMRPLNQKEVEQYTWNLFSIQNDFAARAFKEGIGAHILDGSRLLSLRGDGHREEDCIHYWLPGPPDWLNKMIFNEWLALYGHLLDLVPGREKPTTTGEATDGNERQEAAP